MEGDFAKYAETRLAEYEKEVGFIFARADILNLIFVGVLYGYDTGIKDAQKIEKETA